MFPSNYRDGRAEIYFTRVLVCIKTSLWKQVLSELVNWWKGSLTHTDCCQKCLSHKAALKVVCTEKQNWQHTEKNEITPFVSLQYTKKPWGWIGWASCFAFVFLKYTLNLRSHSSQKAPRSPRMAVTHMAGKLHKLEERHFFTLCSYLLLSSSPPVTDEHVVVQLPQKIPRPSCYHKKIWEASIHFKFLPQFSEAILMENRFDLISGRRFCGSFAVFFLGEKKKNWGGTQIQPPYHQVLGKMAHRKCIFLFPKAQRTNLIAIYYTGVNCACRSQAPVFLSNSQHS